MALAYFSEGSIFKGFLNMFGGNYEYHLKLKEINAQGIFNFEHSIYMMGMLADKKSGSGSIETINEHQLKLIYQDSETKFEAILDVNNGNIKGEATQIDGLYSSDTGNFDLSYDNK
jgi:hypothetical protein